MLQRIKQLSLGLILLTLSFSAFAAKLSLTTKDMKLGRTTVKVLIYSSPKPGLTYFHPHQDETTALVAGKRTVQHYGGEIITLAHGGGRLIRFYIGKQLYIVDPNRIFTNVGIQHTLRLYGQYSDKALEAVQKFSKQLTNLFSTKVIVTVHNNTGGHYSDQSYKKSGDLAKDAAKVYLNPKIDSEDFIYVTTEPIYKSLLPYKFNVILQNSKTVIDDGSLSVYSLYHNIPYVNVEAGYHHLKRQLAMLAAVHTVIMKKGL